jgi:hypothetical protein
MPPAPNQREKSAVPGLPPGFKMFSLEATKGLNTKDTRPAIDDQELSWCENYMRIGNGNLRTMWDVGPALFTATGGLTIIAFFPFNIGAVNFFAVFLSDGTAVAVRNPGGAITTISAVPGTFFTAGGQRPAVAQWGSSGILIVSTAQANGYWAWDGTTLFSPGGGVSPVWLNGGTPTAMPTGITGSSIEIFQSRVWIFNDTTGVGSISAPSNGATFAAGAGGTTITSTDSFLKVGFHAVKQANGYLYPFGDSSVQVISNVQTLAGITTFNNANTDPQTGTPWRDSVAAYGRALLFANPTGIYGLYGGAAEKISDKFDGIFATASLPVNGTALPPAAVATVFGIKIYCLLLTILDPFTSALRPVLLCWDGKTPFLASQSKALTYIATAETNSLPVAWGTDGATLFQLFAAASTSLTKKLQSKLWAGAGYIIYKQAMRLYTQLEDNSGAGATLSTSIDTDVQSNLVTISNATAFTWINNSGQAFTWKNNSNQAFAWGAAAALAIAGQDAQGTIGRLLGFTVTSTSSDYTVISLALGYRDQTGFY